MPIASPIKVSLKEQDQPALTQSPTANHTTGFLSLIRAELFFPDPKSACFRRSDIALG